jgi:hypothetical protein
MKAERLILSFVAIIIGLAVAGLAFYLYQMTKSEPTETKKITTEISPTPTPDDSLFLTLDSPKNEEVLSTKTVKIAGKTTPDAIIVVNTETNDEVVEPTANGAFSLTQTIGNDVNLIQVTAIFPNGEEKVIQRTVTYNIENF